MANYNKYSVYKLRQLSSKADSGDVQAQTELRTYNTYLTRQANRRMTLLEKKDFDYYAYDRAISYVQAEGTYEGISSYNRFQTDINIIGDYDNMAIQIQELQRFLQSKSSTISGQREIIRDRIRTFKDRYGIDIDPSTAKDFFRYLGTEEVNEILEASGKAKRGYGSAFVVEALYGEFIDTKGQGGEIMKAIENYNSIDEEGNRKGYFDDIWNKLKQYNIKVGTTR